MDASAFASIAPQMASQKNAEAWDKYVKQLGKLVSEASGFERDKLRKQYEDAQKQRDNAWKIAEYQTKSQREIADDQLAFNREKFGQEQAMQEAAMLGYLQNGQATLDREKFEQQYQFERDKWAEQYELERRKQGFTEEQARADRLQRQSEFDRDYALKMGQTTGMVNGQMTDASRQWQAQLGLEAAKTAAQLSQNPGDVFQLAAFYDQAQQQGALRDAGSILNSTLSSGRGSDTPPGTQNMTTVLGNMGVPLQPSARPFLGSGAPPDQLINTTMASTPEREALMERYRQQMAALSPEQQQSMREQAIRGTSDVFTRVGRGPMVFEDGYTPLMTADRVPYSPEQDLSRAVSWSEYQQRMADGGQQLSPEMQQRMNDVQERLRTWAASQKQQFQNQVATGSTDPELIPRTSVGQMPMQQTDPELIRRTSVGQMPMQQTDPELIPRTSVRQMWQMATPYNPQAGYTAPTNVQAGSYQPTIPAAFSPKPPTPATPSAPPFYTPTPPGQSSLKQQTDAFANEAYKLAQDANQWAPGQWESYTPTKQALLKGAWKSKGLNPDDVLFKNSVSGLGNEDPGRSA